MRDEAAETRCIGIAVVGCGQIAEAHLKGVKAVPGASLAATVDRDESRARSASERYGSSRWTTDYDAALSDPSVDAVVLCLPHDLHLPFTVKAAQARKHVLVEKPMALSEFEGRQMVAAADAAGVKLMVGQSTRFTAPMQRARAIVDAGTIGRIVHALRQTVFWVEKLSTDWRRDLASCGGLYLPLFGSHDVDHLLWLLDDTPHRVWAAVRATHHVSGGDSDGAIGMTFADGKTASIAFSLRSRNTRQETILVGTEGTLSIDRRQVVLNGQPEPVEEGEGAFTRQMRAFVAAIAAGEEPPASGREVLRVLRTLDLARASSERGEVMKF